MIRFIEMFVGVGGFRLALERVGGFRCVWANDSDKWACRTYRKNFGDKELVEGDIREIDAKSILGHNLLTAGFPCQSFSVAGRRRGFEDTRGTLFYEICRVLRDKRPPLVLLENVKGLLSHGKGRTFAVVLLSLDELGYDVEWQVCNSKNYGVPQNRERVFVVGHLRGEGCREVFPLRGSDGISEKKNERTSSRNETSAIRQAKSALMNRGKTYVIHNKRQATELRVQSEPCVTKHYGTGGGNVPLVIGNVYPSEEQAGQVFDPSDLSKGIVLGKRGEAAIMPIIDQQRVANAVDCDGYLRQMGVHHDRSLCHYRLRRLTPVECERLQGFPDSWTAGVSDTQRYRQMGNAVTVNVVEAIGKKIKEAWLGHGQQGET